MTFNEASAVEEGVSQPQRQHGGRRRALGEGTRRRLFCMTPRSTSVGPFCCRSRGWLACYSAGFLWRERVILRACEASGGERGRPTGTSKQRDQASDLLRRERESIVVETRVAFWGERVSGVGRRRQRRAITTGISDVTKKATLGGNQVALGSQ
jgi:hypothetical protein